MVEEAWLACWGTGRVTPFIESCRCHVPAKTQLGRIPFNGYLGVTGWGSV